MNINELIPVSPMATPRCGECGCPTSGRHATHCSRYDHRKLITNYRESRATKHEEGVSFLCDCCLQTRPVNTSPVGTGYGYTSNAEDAKTICYECLDKLQIEDLKDRSRPFVGYLSQNQITSWTGGELMRVVSSLALKHI